MVKTYGQMVYRDGPDGEKIPFKVSAKTLVIYKEFTGNDLLKDLISTCNLKMQDYYSLSKEEVEKKTSHIAKNIDDKKAFEVMQNLILCARLAAYPTEAEMQEALGYGTEILPVELLTTDMDLGAELMNLVLGDIKKKQ